MTDSIRGKRFCFTGTIKYTRTQLETKLRAKGAYVTNKTENAHYLVIGVRPGKTKLNNCYSWTKKLTQDEFLILLGENVDYSKPKPGDLNAIAAIQKNEHIELFMEQMEEVLVAYTDLAEDVIREYVARAEAKTILKLHKEMKNG